MDFKVRRTALIDADFIAYRLAAWAHGNQADSMELNERIADTFGDWLYRGACTDFVICFSCDRESNFRKDHYPLYKSHRTGEPPAMLTRAKDTLRGYAEACEQRVVTLPRIEADDIMGILATNGNILNPVIITEDKDLRQIPGWHFNPAKEDFPVYIDLLHADHAFHMQWLTGDSTDNFGGIKGMGPKKAAKLLGTVTPSSWEETVVGAYIDAGYTLDQCIAQARCARILRHGDFDSKTRTPRPWSPHLQVIGAFSEAEGD